MGSWMSIRLLPCRRRVRYCHTVSGAPKDHVLYFEDSPLRVRVVFGGETVADCRRAKLLHEAGLLPVYYFPIEDVRMELLEESDHTTHCPFKGDASHCSA